jgi:hypothetical protein
MGVVHPLCVQEELSNGNGGNNHCSATSTKELAEAEEGRLIGSFAFPNFQFYFCPKIVIW